MNYALVSSFDHDTIPIGPSGRDRSPVAIDIFKHEIEPGHWPPYFVVGQSSGSVQGAFTSRNSYVQPENTQACWMDSHARL